MTKCYIYNNSGILGSRCLQDLVSRFSQLHVSSKIINVKHGIRLEIAKNNSMKSFVVFTSISTLNETLVEVRYNILKWSSNMKNTRYMCDTV
jgi:hypothetical protein